MKEFGVLRVKLISVDMVVKSSEIGTHRVA